MSTCCAKLGMLHNISAYALSSVYKMTAHRVS